MTMPDNRSRLQNGEPITVNCHKICYNQKMSE